MDFNPALSTIMHIDLNSCFATIEQQANPHLRGKPIAVAAYTTPNGCILAPSIEAKKYGVKTGMKVRDGRLFCPDLIILPSDPAKYRNIHLALHKLVADYTNKFSPKSIDEFVLNFAGMPSFPRGLFTIGKEIKERIKKEIGEWLTVSIGISTNRFLAKTAAGLHKPDGLDEINKDNFLNLYSGLKLIDLCGIKIRNKVRLNSMGIFNVLDFYNAPLWKLKAAFESVSGYYWYMRLKGFEIDDVSFSRKSYGNSYALPASHQQAHHLLSILSKLTEKTSFRLRRGGYKARGVHLAILFRNGRFWHKGVTTSKDLFDSRDIYKEISRLFTICSIECPVREIAVSVFDLVKNKNSQFTFFEDIEKKERLVKSVDKINERWGSFVITSARMLNTKDLVPDRIAFGSSD